MSIRMKLIMISLAPLLSGALLAVLLIVMMVQYGSLNQRQQLANRILILSHEMSTLAHQYAQSHTQQIEQQWMAAHQELSSTIEGLSARVREQDDSVRILEQCAERIRQEFLNLSRTPADATESMLVSSARAVPYLDALFATSTQLISLAEQEHTESSQLTMHIFRLGLATALILTLAGPLGFLLLAGLISRTILERIGRIRIAMEHIMANHFDHRIDYQQDDELGDLATQFDRMASTLQQSLKARDELLVQISRQNKELEANVSERTAHLCHANERLAAANDELEQFTYAASHDLKNPIITFLGFLSLMERQIEVGDKAGTADSLNRMKAASHRMQHLIDDLLELSRIGRIEAAPEPVDVRHVVDGFIQSNADQLNERHISVVSSDRMPVLKIARPRFEQIIHNLLNNAVKYGCPGDSGTITVTSDETDDEVQIAIHDDGPGIPEEYQERIFGLFQRLDSHTEGTGVGLALVKRAVACHGGRVWVESKPGYGTSFWIAFPLHLVCSSQAVMQPSSANTGNLEPKNGSQTVPAALSSR